MNAVVVRLMGGLGNQMFQYAAGAAIAERQNVPLLLDLGFLEHRVADMTWTPRELELDRLQAPIAIADRALVRSLRRPADSGMHKRLHALLPALFPERYVREKSTAFDPRIPELRPPVYLEGFWQNEAYFDGIASKLRNEWFIPRDTPDDRNREILEQIAAGPCASVHVRRGDYVGNPDSNAFHGTCGPEYYESAARALLDQHAIERFFVFGDEPDWARAHLKLPRPAVHVSHNMGRASHWDMHLMRRCTHHIIANSSFSWWGAWLNPSSAKTVIGPRRWFQGNDKASADILPRAWTAL